MGTAAGCPRPLHPPGRAAREESGCSREGARPGPGVSVALPAAGGLQSWPQPVVQHLACPGQSSSVSQRSRQGPREPRSSAGHTPGFAAALRLPGGDRDCSVPGSCCPQPHSQHSLGLPPSCPLAPLPEPLTALSLQPCTHTSLAQSDPSELSMGCQLPAGLMRDNPGSSSCQHAAGVGHR